MTHADVDAHGCKWILIAIVFTINDTASQEVLGRSVEDAAQEKSLGFSFY